MTPDKFNIRVYGLVIKDQKLLLVKERLRNFSFVKFPGGGVEKGEGTLDALRREVMEEIQTRVLTIDHFYTTDFFQVSAFNPAEQIISIYYKITLENYPEDGYYHQEPDHEMHFFWKSLRNLNIEDVTFPIDQYVINKILSDGLN